MRDNFVKRTGAFGPEDPWFETRSRAFWDDALTTQGFAERARSHLQESVAAWIDRLTHAHRGLFTVDDAGKGAFEIADVWSGAQFVVEALDDAQTLALEHAEGVMDARVVALDASGRLAVLPGAFHHAPDASEPSLKVLTAARDRAMSTNDALDALLRMELVFRRSSRVKVAFAYRVEGLPPL